MWTWRSARPSSSSIWFRSIRGSSWSRVPFGTQATIPNQSLGRHVMFGAAFTIGSFAACAAVEGHRSNVRAGQETWIENQKLWDQIRRRERARDPVLIELEYEPLLDRIRRRIQMASESTKLLAVITVSNIAVFGLWQIPAAPIRHFMKTWFVSDPRSARLLPHLFSGFSHRTGLHLALNMAALWSFGSAVANQLGTEQFAFVYGSTLVISSIASHICAIRAGRWRPSLGASGGILGLVSMFTFMHPDRRLMLMFLPFVSFPAWAGLAGIAAFDSLGLMLGWQTFDHAAHLSGMLCGILYSAQLHKWSWDQRRIITDMFTLKPRPK